MANFKKGIALALAAATAFTFAPVSTLGTPVVAEAAYAQFSDSSINLTVGASTTYQLNQPNGAENTAEVTFKTSDPTVANVTVGGQHTQPNTASTGSSNAVTQISAEWGDIQTSNIVVNAENNAAGKSANITVEFVNEVGVKNTYVLTVNVKAKSNQLKGFTLAGVTDSISVGGNTTVRKDATTASHAVGLVDADDDDENGTNAANGDKFVLKTVTSSNDKIVNVTGTNLSYVGVGTATITVSVERTLATDSTKKTNEDYKFNVTVIPADSTFKIGDKEVTATTASTAATPTSVIYLTGTNASKAIGATLTDAAPGEELVYTCTTDGVTPVTTNGTTDIAVKNDVVTANANAFGVGVNEYFVTVDVKNSSNVVVKHAVVKVVTERTEKAFSSLAVNVEGKDYKSEASYDTDTTPGPTQGATIIKSVPNTDAKLALSTSDKKSVPFTVTSNSTNGWEVKSSDENTVAIVGNEIVGKRLGSATLTFTNKADTTHYGAATVVVNVSVTTQLLDTKVVAENETINLNKVTKSAKIAASVVATPALAKQPELTYEFVTKNADGTYTKANSTDLSLAKDGTVTYTTDKTGEAIVAVSAPATNEYAAPKTAYVTVKYTSAKSASKLAVSTKSVNVEAGKTAAIVATGTALTYASSDETIATVAADGTVTGVKTGVAIVTVTDAGDENTEGGSVDVPVYVKAKAAVVVAKPAKVTSLKVANVKGAKVKVSFKKSAKATGYLVTYKVGKKTVKKTTTKTALTLSVKKGAKVKVSVKAFNKNAAGAKQYSAAVSKTLKTDKK